MSINLTHCKEFKRISELNFNYVQLIRHLRWQNRSEELLEVINLQTEMANLICDLSQDELKDLISTRATALFILDLDTQELSDCVSDRINRQFPPQLNLITHHASLLTLAENPARSFLKTLLSEIQHWSTFSTNTAYKFSMAQHLINQIGELDTGSLIKLALSERTTLRPRFNLAQLSALGKTGLIPAGLLFD